MSYAWKRYRKKQSLMAVRIPSATHASKNGLKRIIIGIALSAKSLFIKSRSKTKMEKKILKR